jgi:hypothetical protein
MGGMKMIFLVIPAALFLCGCSTVGRAMGVVTRPVGGLLNTVTAPVRSL